MNIGSRWSWWLFTGVTMLWLLWMTLRPDSTLNRINLIPMAEHGQALACFVQGDCVFHHQTFRFLLIDVVGNIIVFVPLGVGLAGILHQGKSWQTVCQATLVGFLFSLTIELIQFTIPSRATDVDDLIFNTLGAMVGALLFILFFQSKVGNRSESDGVPKM